MRKDDTPNLWKDIRAGLDMLATDEKLRAEVTPVIDDLATAFEEVQEVSRSADPLIQFKVWALSSIGAETIGVTGFVPREFVRDNLKVLVRVAPIHDMTDFDGTPIATRVIKLESDPTDNVSTAQNGIEIFGLNIFVPNADEGLSDLESGAPKLIVFDQKGGTSVAKKPVSGITPVIAIRNKTSGVTKAYSVDILNEQPEELLDGDRHRIVRQGNTLIFIVPDGRYVRIEMLTEEKLAEVLDEFKKAIEAIKASDALSSLTVEERNIGLSHISGKFDA